MLIDTMGQAFRAKVSAKIDLVAEGLNRYRVLTPFRFADGDHLVIVLKQDAEGWMLSDEAHTYMHLSYEMDERDLLRGTRQKIISDTLSVFQVEDRQGELVLSVPDEQYGDALYSFVQALLRVSNVSYLSREQVRSTFMDDFRAALAQWVHADRRSFDWHDPVRDPRGIYEVDCRIDATPRPILVHALTNDGRTRDATISLLQFEKWDFPHRSLAIFEDQESINRKVLARFSDVCEKQYSNLPSNRDRIERYLDEVMSTREG